MLPRESCVILSADPGFKEDEIRRAIQSDFDLKPITEMGFQTDTLVSRHVALGLAEDPSVAF